METVLFGLLIIAASPVPTFATGQSASKQHNMVRAALDNVTISVEESRHQDCVKEKTAAN